MKLEEYKNKMTLFYSKRTGEIQTYCTGIQDMNFFGSNKEDYELIWDFIVADYNDKVLKNISLFKVNLEANTLEVKNIII